MLIFSGLVVWALMVTAESGIGPSTNSSFCTESRECLEYELVCKTDQYEVRHYSPTRWVSTDAEAYFLGVGAAMAFRRLFQYITGANHLGLQMEMTAPVLVRVPEETRVWEPAVYTLNFLLPLAYQDNPPSPTNEKLYFTDMPDLDVYVRGYGGWMLSVSSRLHAHLLSQQLQLLHAPYNLSYHYGVGYDSPLKLLNRHNEVWYVAEGEVVCNDSQEPTSTPPPSDTPTHTPTHTPSHTPSDTPTHTPTQKPSDTPIHTPTHTLSDTPSHTPTDTPTRTPSQSAANSPMPFPSHPPVSDPSSDQPVSDTAAWTTPDP
ncbi:heme-binding protein 2-like [Hypomesus transpacificus]|uniref:heme-binding protein 2-like n=1 Tax=Hypomesus transpacificus TaxID=137520 RepID=UPI001F07CCAB|nr:heme-binding protein 2-like [Hypomesus transpacificus]